MDAIMSSNLWGRLSSIGRRKESITPKSVEKEVHFHQVSDGRPEGKL